MKTDKIKKQLGLSEKARQKFDSTCDKVLSELIPFLDFCPPEMDFFFVEYQPSDGICLADSDSHVYHIPLILDHIEKEGRIKSLRELRQFSI